MRRYFPLPVRRVLTSCSGPHKVVLCFERFCGDKPVVSTHISTALGRSNKETTTAATPSSVAGDASEKLREQIRGLSEEDQRLIFTALQNPEQLPSSKMGGAGIGTKSADMVAAFTCGRCEHRMVKKFSKHAYTKGIVIVQCPSCEVKHLLADNLGWFVDEAKNIEEFLREKGEAFVRIGDDFQVEPPSADESMNTKK